MQEPHIYLKDNKQEIKITILERKEGQSLCGIDENYELPVKIEYKSGRKFFKDELKIETYDILEFYCSLDEIANKDLKSATFSFDEAKMSIKIEIINEDFNVVLWYKEKEEIVVKQKLNKKRFNELIKKVHQGCNLWFDDSDLIEFREYLDDIENGYYDEGLPSHRVAEVEFKNSGKLCCYLCEDESIKKGDLVVVPTFFDKKTIAKIIGIEYFDEDDLPCSLDKMKKVIKKYAKPLSDKIGVHSYDITESGFGFELLVNFVFQKNNKKEFSIKDKNACFNVYLNEYKDVYLDVYKEMLELNSNEMKITKGLWLTAQKVLHVGLDEKRKNLKNLFLNILSKAKELKIQWVGIPCMLERYCGISPKAMFKIALKSVKEWILQNENYDMEILFCCPNEKLYEKFKKIYSKEIENKSWN